MRAHCCSRPVLPHIVFPFALLLAASADEQASPDFDSAIVPLLEAHCYDCHNPSDARGATDLESLDSLQSARPHLKVWAKVREQVESGTMPPSSRDPLPEERRSQLLAWIAANENFYRSGAITDPGRTLVRRLSNTEYRYSIQDLLGISLDPAEGFPADGGGGEGFDNVADTLFIPPLLMEKYIEATDRALDEAFSAAPARSQLMPRRPDDKTPPAAALHHNLALLARRAFRRTPRQAELDQLLAVALNQFDHSHDFDQAMRLATSAVLLSPHFLLRLEPDQDAPSSPWPVDPFVLASRLSYLFWSSLPDDQLLDAAAAGQLADHQQIIGQVDRMLADPKAARFALHFGGQWLGFEKVLTHVDPDRQRFGAFDDSLRTAFHQEALLFIDHILRGDGSFLEVIDSKHTFANSQLASFYGIPDVQGEEMRRVTLPEGSPRGGLLTMGATLSSTSFPRRTSPVLRGTWILSEILGTPPPPPPPNVGEIPPDENSLGAQSLRDRLAQHRDKPACFNCHARLDPLGIALENFDAVGAWRERERDLPIDASAEMPSGEQIDGPAGLRNYLLSEREKFARTISEKLLAYALNRPLEPFDEPSIASLMETLFQNDFAARPTLNALVTSYPFLHRRLHPVLPDREQ